MTRIITVLQIKSLNLRARLNPSISMWQTMLRIILSWPKHCNTGVYIPSGREQVQWTAFSLSLFFSGVGKKKKTIRQTWGSNALSYRPHAVFRNDQRCKRRWVVLSFGNPNPKGWDSSACAVSGLRFTFVESLGTARVVPRRQKLQCLGPRENCGSVGNTVDERTASAVAGVLSSATRVQLHGAWLILHISRATKPLGNRIF